MFVRLSGEEKENSEDEKGNSGMAQGQCTQGVQIGQDLMCFDSSRAIFIIFLTNCFIVSFITNFVHITCPYTAYYISLVR